VIESRDLRVINQVINTFTRENEQLLDQLNQIGYYMRGFYTRDDVYQLTAFERDKAITFLNKRFKDAGEFMKKQIPVFI
jgi:hypothetical protein